MRSAASAHARPAAVSAGNAERLAALLRQAGPGGTVVFTGAGVSTESGIPDFRSPGGVWSRYAPIAYADYLRDAAMRRESWQRGLHTYAAIADAQPNAAHRAIAQWWHVGLVSGVVTQNIDGLHQRAGLPDTAVVELHGNSHWVGCLACAARFDRPSIHARLLAGEAEPRCEVCGGMLKTTTVSFGQGLPEAAVGRARRLHARAALALVIGSSLVVYPAATLPVVTLEAGGLLAIVNKTETHLDEHAVLLAREPAAELLGQVADLLGATWAADRAPGR